LKEKWLLEEETAALLCKWKKLSPVTSVGLLRSDQLDVSSLSFSSSFFELEQSKSS
jgi:hypothetical protein